MSTHLISGTHWLEPLLPERLPDSLLAMADRLPFEAGKLTYLKRLLR
ncbi:MAG: hypothetical protein ACOH2I_02615 [Pseudomonas sp.]